MWKSDSCDMIGGRDWMTMRGRTVTLLHQFKSDTWMPFPDKFPMKDPFHSFLPENCFLTKPLPPVGFLFFLERRLRLHEDTFAFAFHFVVRPCGVMSKPIEGDHFYTPP